MDQAFLSGNAYTAPIALVFSDSAAGGSAASNAVFAAGGRLAASLDISLARERILAQIGLDAIIIDVTRDHGAPLDQLLDHIDAVCAQNDIPTIISLTPELIDTVSARTNGNKVTLLCQPDSAELVSALSCAWIDMPVMVNEMSADLDNVRLRRLADEVTRIARALANLSGGTPARPGEISQALQSQLSDIQSSFSAEPAMLYADEMPEPAEIRSMLRLRRLRDSFFDPALFADPAWDMLLDLMAAKLEGDQVAVSSLCIAAAVPPTTALRWIKAMTDHNLFERHADPTDGRRIFLRLSDGATIGMARYFAAAKRIGGLAA